MKDHRRAAFLVPLMAALFSAQVQAAIYKVVDEHGNVTYTDKAPHPDATPVDLPGLSVISPQRNPSATVTTAGQAAFEDEDTEEVTSVRQLRRGYRDFHLVSPTQEEALWNTNNTASVAWDARYQLQAGMSVVIYLDGVAQEPTSAPVIHFERLDRGEHTVKAELFDRRNRKIASSETVTFYIMQPSVLNPRRRNQGG